MQPWHLGNTTVRSPFRLRNGLVALSTSPLQGNLHGREQEIAIRHLLGEYGIVDLGEDDTYSVGRKWRSALCKLGFLYPAIASSAGIEQSDLGPVDMITPNGWRLIRAETVPAMQECFLRALAAYYIPSLTEKRYDFQVFSPLRHVLSVMVELEKSVGESRISFLEMAAIIQLTSSDDDLKDIVDKILSYRKDRAATELNKKKFDKEFLAEQAKFALKPNGKPYEGQTFNDYADTNFRYLKATGLVQSKGRGISILPEKLVFIEQLINDTTAPETDLSYLVGLCNGAALPTDNKDSALIVLDDLIAQAKSRKISYSVIGKAIDTPADIALLRHEIESLLSAANEEEYAKKQVAEWEEISGYMSLLISRKARKQLPNGNEIEIPQSESPAYFEWILWRAFLAINNLENRPYEARRFKIDQDFLPVGTAPGNGPDLIFEFKEFVLVVEVTLTDSSRQEAAEGEPVRRHVADLVTHYADLSAKPVYGLFIANRIDSNTAETFRIGVWYARDDKKMTLDIVPITLSQFQAIFEALFKSNRIDALHIRELLDECGLIRPANEAPAWKQEIDRIVQGKVANLLLA